MVLPTGPVAFHIVLRVLRDAIPIRISSHLAEPDRVSVRSLPAAATLRRQFSTRAIFTARRCASAGRPVSVCPSVTSPSSTTKALQILVFADHCAG